VFLDVIDDHPFRLDAPIVLEHIEDKARASCGGGTENPETSGRVGPVTVPNLPPSWFMCPSEDRSRPLERPWLAFLPFGLRSALRVFGGRAVRG
jgi:hypothetical protein